MTKFGNYLYRIYDLTEQFDYLLMTLTAGTVALNIVYDWLLLMVLSIKMKK